MQIVTYPDSRLRQKTEKITKIDGRLRELIDEMFQAMRDDHGVGLAAPQVGIGKRLVVMNVTGNPADDMVLINPRIVSREGSETDLEGCLSIPGISANVERAATVVVKFLDQGGRSVEMRGSGLLARAFQHEIDHLDGVLFIDRLTDEERSRHAEAIRQLEQSAAG